MERQKTRDTAPERLIRSSLHRLGLRYRLHSRPLQSLRRHADIVFRPARVAVFIDGCFWHGCPDHRPLPRANRDWWLRKLEENKARDADTDAQLRAAGWLPIRIWEHEDPDEAALKIADVVRKRTGAEPSRGSC